MAAKHVPRCTHIKINGRRCGSPALRGEFFSVGHRLFDIDVLARAQRVEHDAPMPVIRGRHDHRVDVFAVQMAGAGPLAV